MTDLLDTLIYTSYGFTNDVAVKRFANLSLKSETVESIRQFLGYTSVSDFVEKAVKEKLERERKARSNHGISNASTKVEVS